MEDFDYTRESLLILLNFLILCVYCVGVHLLRRLGGEMRAMHTHLISMSVGVITISILSITSCVLQFLIQISNDSIQNNATTMSNHTITPSFNTSMLSPRDKIFFSVYVRFELVAHTGIMFVIYASIIAIGVDKARESLLGDRYRVDANVFVAKCTSCVIWIVAFLVCGGALFAYETPGVTRNSAIFVYYHLTLDAMFVSFVLGSYCIVFYKRRVDYKNRHKQIIFRPSRQHSSVSSSNSQVVQEDAELMKSTTSKSNSRSMSQKADYMKDFRLSRSFVPFLLTLTFLFFTFLPHMFSCAYFFLSKHNNNSNTVRTVIEVVYRLSYLCQVVIYMIVDTAVKKLLVVEARRLRYSLVFRDVPSYPRLMRTPTLDENTFSVATSM